MSQQAVLNISIVLDRSGSMGAIADDIVGGFNQFLAAQRASEGDALVTLVQFDSEDPFEVLIDRAEVAEVNDLDATRYQPRSLTPLYDAVGRMINRIDAGIAKRADAGEPIEDQLVVIVTDGQENASVEFDRSDVFGLVEERRERAWSFVYLGANQDTYVEGGKMGVAGSNAAPWTASPDGSEAMWDRVSKSTTAHRAKTSYQRRADADKFLEDDEE